MDDRSYNAIVAAALGVGVFLIIGFVMALIGSNPGEIAAALGALIGGIAAGTAAYVGVRTTINEQAKTDAETKAAELAGIRLALHTEVSAIGLQCHIELASRRASGPARSPVVTARLPRLIVYEANANKIGLLTREEILALIGFSGTLHDIVSHVDDMSRLEPFPGPDARQALMVLLSNACGLAADFLEAVPGIPGAEQDRPLIAELRAAHDAMASARGAVPTFRRSDV
jgi:hypothetical protein